MSLALSQPPANAGMGAWRRRKRRNAGITAALWDLGCDIPGLRRLRGCLCGAVPLVVQQLRDQQPGFWMSCLGLECPDATVTPPSRWLQGGPPLPEGNTRFCCHFSPNMELFYRPLKQEKAPNSAAAQQDTGMRWMKALPSLEPLGFGFPGGDLNGRAGDGASQCSARRMEHPGAALAGNK